MQLIHLAALLFSMLWCSSVAFIVDKPKLAYTLNKKRNSVSLDSIDKKLEKPISGLGNDSAIKFGFELSKYGDILPEQIILLMGIPELNLEFSIEPIVKNLNGKATVKFDYSLKNLPLSILHYGNKENKNIIGTIVISSNNPKSKKDNIFNELFELNLDYEQFVFDTYKEPERFGTLPELAHTFPAPPKTVSAWFSQVFSLIVAFVGFALIVTWLSFGVIKFDNMPKGLDLLYFIGFIVTVIGFEYIFINYYLGASIFDTLNVALYLGAFGLVVGTKFLRSFGQSI